MTEQDFLRLARSHPKLCQLSLKSVLRTADPGDFDDDDELLRQLRFKDSTFKALGRNRNGLMEPRLATSSTCILNSR